MPEPAVPTRDAVLEAHGLSKHFALRPTGRGRLRRRVVLRAVDDVSFVLRPGTVTAVVGESGSGKSTIAKLLMRLHSPSGGTIMLGSEDVCRIAGPRDLRRYRSHVQMIFQDPFGSLNPAKRVEHHIARPLRIHGVVPRQGVHGRVLELLTTVGLVPAEMFAAKYPHELSGGQQQRVAIARALAAQPAVVIADEPISMLDVSIRLGILNLMLELKEKRGLAFLYITHDIASARYVADELLVMYAGQVVERGPTDEVLQNPLHPYTRLLLSAVPNPGAGLKGDRVVPHRASGGETDLYAGCRFTARCPVAFEPCHGVPPELLEPEQGHLVRCHLYEPTGAGAGGNRS
jgi:peptide/nickel transport system ATP-binding protein